MKQLLLICALVVGQSVLAADKKPLTKDESVKVIEAAIRKAAKKPTGELTKADKIHFGGIALAAVLRKVDWVRFLSPPLMFWSMI